MPNGNLANIQPYQLPPQNRKLEAARDIIQGVVSPISMGYGGFDTISPLIKGQREVENTRTAQEMATHDRLLKLRQEQLYGQLSKERNVLAELLGKERLKGEKITNKAMQEAEDMLEKIGGEISNEDYWRLQQMRMGGVPRTPTNVNVQQSREDMLNYLMDNDPYINSFEDKAERRAEAVDMLNIMDPQSRKAQGDRPKVSQAQKNSELTVQRILKKWKKREQSDPDIGEGELIGQSGNKWIVNRKENQKQFLKEVMEKIDQDDIAAMIDTGTDYADFLNQLQVACPDLSREEINLAINEDAQNLKKALEEQAKKEIEKRLKRSPILHRRIPR